MSDGVAELVDDRAKLSAFEDYRESSVDPERLFTFEDVIRITVDREFSANEIAEHRRWFESAVSIWHYTFESQYSGILFIDNEGRVQHAILLG